MAKKIIFTKSQTDEIIKKYNNGISLRELSKELNHSRSFLSKLLKENNVIIKDNTINSRKYIHNENFFKTIDSEVKAYWLGFMYADGFIESKRQHGNQKFGITLNSIDIKHLEKFKKSIESSNPIKNYIGSGYNAEGEFSKILLTSQKTVNDLIANGCLENKTHLLKFPDLKRDLIPHFIRGYFDGDGSLSYYVTTKRQYKIGFVGTYDFLNGIMKYFNKELKFSTKDCTTYQLNIGGNNQVKTVMNILYKNATIFLDRKYDKYLELLKYSES